MVCRNANSLAKRNKVMSPEQFNQVVEAITEGRYSWACVLILRFAGYNPVYFIPYRTYSRLVKENQFLKRGSDAYPNQGSRSEPRQPKPLSAVIIGDLSVAQSLRDEDNLSTIENIAEPEANLRGGGFVSWLGEIRNCSVLKQFLNQSLNSSQWP